MANASSAPGCAARSARRSRGWMEVREETARLNRKLRVAVAKFTRRDVYNAFAAWCESLRIGTRERQSALRVFSEVRYSLRDRADAFYTWSQSVEGARVQNLNPGLPIHPRVDQSRVLVRVHPLARRRPRAQTRTSDPVQLVGARARARRHLGVPRVARTRAGRVPRARARARRAAHRMRDRHLASAFHAWSGAVAETRERSMCVRISEKFLAAIQNATLYRAFGAWRETTAANKTNERKVLLARHRARRVTRARAFDTWIEATEASRRRRVVVARSDRFLRAATRRVQSAAFHRWDEYAAERASARRRLSVALALLQPRRAARSTDGRIASRRRDDGARPLAKVLDRWNGAATRSAWWSWRSAILDVRRLRVVERRFAAAAHRSTRRALRAWADRARTTNRHVEVAEVRFRAVAVDDSAKRSVGGLFPSANAARVASPRRTFCATASRRAYPGRSAVGTNSWRSTAARGWRSREPSRDGNGAHRATRFSCGRRSRRFDADDAPSRRARR